jgi:hypothetical protein
MGSEAHPTFKIGLFGKTEKPFITSSSLPLLTLRYSLRDIRLVSFVEGLLWGWMWSFLEPFALLTNHSVFDRG